jgi:hypothetical protein
VWPERDAVGAGAHTMTIGSVYRDIFSIASLPPVQSLATLLLVWKLPFMAFDAVLFFRLVRRGFRRSKLASLALVQFPFDVLFSILAGRWSRGAKPLAPVRIAYLARLAVTLVGPALLYTLAPLEAPSDDFPLHTYAAVAVVSLVSSFLSTTIFVSQGAFFNRVADPVVGGTYMTALNTVSNFGGTWPKAAALWAVHKLSAAECVLPDGTPPTTTTTTTMGAVGMEAATAPPSIGCETGEGMSACRAAGGVCNDIAEGYYPVAAACFVIGALVVLRLPDRLARLEQVKRRAWLVRGKHPAENEMHDLESARGPGDNSDGDADGDGDGTAWGEDESTQEIE